MQDGSFPTFYSVGTWASTISSANAEFDRFRHELFFLLLSQRHGPPPSFPSDRKPFARTLSGKVDSDEKKTLSSATIAAGDAGKQPTQKSQMFINTA